MSNPDNGTLLLSGTAIANGQIIDQNDLANLLFIPESPSLEIEEYVFEFAIELGGEVSDTESFTIEFARTADEVTITGGDFLDSFDAPQRVSDDDGRIYDEHAITALNDDRYVVVFQGESLGDSSNRDTYAQIFESDGSPVASQFLIVADVPDASLDHAVTGLDDGGFIIVWSDESGIYGQRYDADGQTLDITGSATGGEFIVQDAGDNEMDVSVTTLSDGGFVVVWSEDSNEFPSPNSSEIRGRVYSNAGVAGTLFDISDTFAGSKFDPVVAAGVDGGFGVVWYRDSSTDIRIRTFDDAGNALSSDQRVNVNNSGAQRRPTIESLNNGRWLVAWDSSTGDDDDGTGIRARLINDGGVPIGTEIQVNENFVGNQYEPTIQRLSGGDVLIAWESGLNDGDSFGLAGQRFEQNLDRIGSEFIINSRTYGAQQEVDVAQLENGNLVFSWNGDGVWTEQLTFAVEGSDEQAIPLDLAVALQDTDGSEALIGIQLVVPAGVTVSGINSGTPVSIVSDGNAINILPWELDSISVTPVDGDADDFEVQIIAENMDGSDSATHDFSINVVVTPTLADNSLDSTHSASVNAPTVIDLIGNGPVYESPDTTTAASELALSPAPTPSGGTLTVSTNGNGVDAKITFDSSAVSIDNNPASQYDGIDAALRFNGTGGGSYDQFSGSGDATIELWFKPDNLTQDSALLDLGSETNGLGVYLKNDQIYVDVVSADTVQSKIYTLVGGGISATEFNHVMVVVDSTGGDTGQPDIALYINGVRTDIITDIALTNAGQFRWAENNESAVGTTSGTFANSAATPLASFTGSISHLNIFDTAVANEEQAELHRLQVATELVVTSVEGQSLTIGTPITLASGGTVERLATGEVVYDGTTLSGSPPSDSFEFEVTDLVSGFTSDNNTADITLQVAISGSVLNDVGADGSVASDAGFANAEVLLFYANGPGLTGEQFLANTFTDSEGRYTFDNLEQGRDYFVVVKSRTLNYSAAELNNVPEATLIWAEQTFSSAGGAYYDSEGNLQFLASDAALFGGLSGDRADDATAFTNSEHINRVTVGNSGASGIDFGFSFNVVTNVADGTNANPIQGSLRQFIYNANAIAGDNQMRFVPVVDANATGASGAWWRIDVNESLTAISDSGTTIDGQAWSVDGNVRDENAVNLASSLDSEVGVATDGSGNRTGLLTAAPDALDGRIFSPTEAGLDAPELELRSVGTADYGISVRAADTAPVIDNIAIRNLSINGFERSNGGGLAGANIFIDGSGFGNNSVEKEISNVEISGNVLGYSAGDLNDPGSLSLASRSANIIVLQADHGVIFDNIIGRASLDGIVLLGNFATVENIDHWQITGNAIIDNGWGSNISDGIKVADGASDITIASNLISGSGEMGIDLLEGSNYTIINNTITGSGASGAAGNGISVLVENVDIVQNEISNNTGDGVHVPGVTIRNNGPYGGGSEVLISQNSFFGNGEQAIDLSESLSGGLTFDDLNMAGDGDGQLAVNEVPAAMQARFDEIDADGNSFIDRSEFNQAIKQNLTNGDGISFNDGLAPVTSGNRGLDFPTIQRAGIVGGRLKIVGQVDPSLNVDRIEIYLATAGDGDSAAGESYGEGSVYLGTYTIDPTDNGNFLFELENLPLTINSADAISAIAIDAAGNTSEFSQNVVVDEIPVVSASQITVTEDTDHVFSINDFQFADSDADAFSVRILSLPQNGDLIFDGNVISGGLPFDVAEDQLSKLVYRPTENYNGASGNIGGTGSNGDDRFEFRIFDGTFQSDAATLSIEIDAVNDEPELDQTAFQVAENSTAGISLTASDVENPAPLITLAAAGPGNNNDLVVLSPAGVLTFNSPPDFESPLGIGGNQYVFDIELNDGTGTFQRQVTIDVTGVNDNAPIFSSPTTIDVVEETNPLIAVEASDADLPTPDITYSIVDGIDQGDFVIDEMTGELTFVNNPDFDAPADDDQDNVYTVRIRAEDADGVGTEQTIEITVLPNYNAAPQVVVTDFQQDENQRPVFTIETTDRESDNVTLSWDPAAGDNQWFDFNTTTGELQFKVAPDAETQRDAGGDNRYEINITATDDFGNVTNQTILVDVRDINDNAPVFVTAADIDVIEETNPVITIEATDADFTNAGLTYSIVDGIDQGDFVINETSGELTFVSNPDFDAPTDDNQNNVYRVRVRAEDSGGVGTEQDFDITVLPSFNEAPKVSVTSFEQAENQRPVFTIETTDRESDNVTLSWDPAAGDNQWFDFDTTTGELQFKVAPDADNPLDSDGDNQYDVAIAATDDFGNVTNATIIVAVTGVNEHDPVFQTPAMISVVEETAPIIAIEATDADLPASAITYSIIGGVDQADFAIEETTGKLSFVNNPDFDTPEDTDGDNVYRVQIRAEDSDGRFVEQIFTITVLPSFNEAPKVAVTSFAQDENLRPVFTIQTTDRESDNVALSWDPNAGDNPLFDFDVATGELQFKASPDFETPLDNGGNNQYEVTITATDDFGNVTNETIIIDVAAVNEHDPVFTSPDSITVVEDTPPTVFVSATDDDDSLTNLSYSIVGGADSGNFTIDAVTGQLNFNQTPDFDAPDDANQDRVYQLTVRADDGDGRSTDQNLSIEVLPSHNEAPELDQTDFTQQENDQPTFIISATDREDDNVTLSIDSSSPDLDQFVFDPVTGELKLVAVPDFELPTDADGDNKYEARINLMDDFGNTSIETVTIRVTGVNEHPPVFVTPSRFDVIEETNPVIIVTATDADLPNQSPTYAIVGGVDSGQFIIDSVTGELTFRNNPDFDAPRDANADNRYEVVVKANDSGSRSANQTLSIVVQPDHNERAEFVRTEFSQAENTIERFEILTTDREGDTVTLSLDANVADGDKFFFDAVTHELRLKTTPNFESPTDVNTDGHYDAVITALDSFGNETTRTITVEVTNVAEIPVIKNDLPTVIKTGNGFSSSESIFANDGPLLFREVTLTQPGNGTVSLNADGTFDFVPNANYTEGQQVNFSYSVNDGGERNSATVQFEAIAGVLSPTDSAVEQTPDNGNENADSDVTPDVPLTNPAEPQTTDTPIVTTGPAVFRTFGADTFSNDAISGENDIESDDFASQLYDSTYDYAGQSQSELIVSQFERAYVNNRVSERAGQDQNELSAAFWSHLDAARRDFMLVSQIRVGMPIIAAASAGFLTSSLVWGLAKLSGGALLTHFTSTKVWSSLDIAALLDASQDDESIEQMVDG